jgi:hypothetical protein
MIVATSEEPQGEHTHAVGVLLPMVIGDYG